jgi:hypothetical protein
VKRVKDKARDKALEFLSFCFWASVLVAVFYAVLLLLTPA